MLTPNGITLSNCPARFARAHTRVQPACGTCGMLITAKDYIQEAINPFVVVVMDGQELNNVSYAIAKSDVLIMDENAENILLGNYFAQDKIKGLRFTYMLSNPPSGVSLKKEAAFIKKEANDPNGRLHAGTPRSRDGAILFLQYMISKGTIRHQVTTVSLLSWNY